MKQLTYQGIKNKIEKENINFLAFVITPWHLVGAKAAYEYAKTEVDDLRPLIVCIPHSETGTAIEDDDEFELCILEKDKKNCISFKNYLFFLINCTIGRVSSEEVIYISNPWWGTFKEYNLSLPSKNNNIRLIIYEEGTGTYEERFWKISYYFGKYPLKTVLQTSVDFFLSSLYKRRGRLCNLTPLKRENGCLVKNEFGLKYYRKIINGSTELFSNRVLLLTQSNDSQELDFFRVVAKTLSDLGLEIYVKPHPRYPLNDDVFDGCNVRIVNGSITAEIMMLNVKAKYCIGLSTTALSTLHLFYDTVSISLCLLRERTEFDNWFIKNYSSVVEFPSTFEEVQKIIDYARG